MTLPGHDHAARRDRVRARLSDLGVDALLVTHAVDVRWLTGLVASNGQVLLTADPNGDLLLTDDRYAQPARATGVPVRVESWLGLLAEDDAVVTTGGPRLGIQSEHVTVRQEARLRASAVGHTLVPTLDVLAMARRAKDEAEVARLERACEITSAGWQWLCEHVRAGQTEAGIARDLVRHLEDQGADGPAFAPIVASGPNSAVPHHRPTDRALGRGELLKVDFGALVDGYHADCTRMLSIGDPGEVLRDVHAAVATAQQAGVEAATQGATARDVHEAAVGWLDGLELGPTLHGVGHGVGLEIHETPILSAEPAAILESGFVVTVEPGIYLAGIGGVRIEDTVAVEAQGPRRLTTCARDLVVL